MPGGKARRPYDPMDMALRSEPTSAEYDRGRGRPHRPDDVDGAPERRRGDPAAGPGDARPAPGSVPTRRGIPARPVLARSSPSSGLEETPITPRIDGARDESLAREPL